MRRVKCDESRPRCAKCVSREACCEYNHVQLKWEPEYQSSGRAFGREGVWSKGGLSARRGIPDQGGESIVSTDGGYSIGKHHFIHTYYDDMACYTLEDPCVSPHTTAAATTSIKTSRQSLSSLASPVRSFILTSSTIPRPLSPYRTNDGVNPGLLEYYLFRVCPLANPLQRTASPLVELVLPLIGSGSQTLATLSAMAFSARHRSLTQNEWSSTALNLKGQALSTLRESLGMADNIGNCVLQNSHVPVAMMFLCLYEIIESCDDRWVIHLKACQDFLFRRKQMASLLVQESAQERDLVSLAERFFAFQDAISRTACGNSSVFSLEYWRRTDREADDEGWMGCSTKLAGLLFKTTELGRTKGEMSAEQFESHTYGLELELARLDAGDTDPIDHLLKKSVKLYQHCSLRNATPTSPIVVELVHEILQSLYDLVQGAEGISNGLAFPLFIAAAELDPFKDDEVFQNVLGNCLSGRRLVLEILQTVSGSCLFNVGRVKDVIRQIWANRDLHAVSGDYGGRSGFTSTATAQNDWHVCVSPYCTNISLV